MKNSTTALLLVVVAVAVTVAAAIALHSCEKSENPSRSYQKHEESLYGGGWVPRYFPADIRDIHEQHDIDTNEVWLRFALGNQAYARASHGYAAVSDREKLRGKIRFPFSSGWWFDEATLSNAEETQLLSGPCRAEGENLPHTQGFVLIHEGVVYWWYQYI